MTFLSEEQQQFLKAFHTQSVDERLKCFAAVILAYEQGLATREIAAQLALSTRSVRYRRWLFQQRGMSLFSLPDQPFPLEVALNQYPSDSGTQADSDSPSAVKKIFRTGILPTDPMNAAGIKVFQYQFEQILAHEAGVRQGEDIEDLHDMRVASRRLRAAFELFKPYFPTKTLKPFRRNLRAIGGALGKVRDWDVFIEKSNQFKESLPIPQQEDFINLLQIWQGKRDGLHQELINLLDSEVYQHFIQRFGHFLEQEPPAAENVAPVGDTIPVLIYTQLATVRAFIPETETASFERLHDIRRALKTLRYTIEFFSKGAAQPSQPTGSKTLTAPLHGTEIDAVIRDLKDIQDHLGELNDADVACGLLNLFQKDYESRQTAVPIGERHSLEALVNYLANRYAERHHLLTTFPAVWQHFNRSEFRRNLAVSISFL